MDLGLAHFQFVVHGYPRLQPQATASNLRPTKLRQNLCFRLAERGVLLRKVPARGPYAQVPGAIKGIEGNRVEDGR